MMTSNPIHADVWAACEAFRGDMSFAQSRDYVLALVFVKYMSDAWHDLLAQVQTDFEQDDERVNRRITRARFTLPQVEVRDITGQIVIDRFLADIYSLNIRREQANIGEMIDRALAELEKNNHPKLDRVFHHLSFNTEAVMGSGPQRNERLRQFLSFLSFLNLRGQPGACAALFLFLIERFAIEDETTPETPRQMARLLLRLVNPCPGEQIADPVAGSACLLLESLYTNGGPFGLFGQEASRNLWAIARMNLFIHEQDDATLLLGECLRAPQLLQGKQLQQFDVVLANPPQRLDPWLLGRADQDAYGRFWRGAPPKSRADYAYISHFLAMTRVGRGRLAVIVPQGILFRGGAEGRIRQQILMENSLDVVITLPPNVLPHTTLPMAVCLFDRSREVGGARAHVRDVLLIDASLGVAPNKNLSLLCASQVDQIIAEVLSRQTQGQRSYLAGIDEIAANDYDLNLPRYLFDREKNAKRNLTEELQEIGELEKQLHHLRNQMMQQLGTLVA